MKFNPNILPPGAIEGPYFKMKSQAEPSSAYSDPPLRSIRINVRGAWDCLCMIYLSLHFRPWETDVVLRTIAQQAYKFEYQDDWQIVQRFLEQRFDSPSDFESNWVRLAERSLEEFYGNLLYRASKLEKIIKYIDMSKAPQRPVRRPQRKRGYADKGSRRLPHEKHGDPPISPDRDDRRKLVRINLFLEAESFAAEGELPDAHPKKGGDFYDPIRSNRRTHKSSVGKIKTSEPERALGFSPTKESST
jgi:hypothetical protein